VPVTPIADLKAHLNITFDTDDGLLTGKLAAAEQCVSDFTGSQFGEDSPAPLKEAVLQLAGHFYENREPVVIGQSVDAIPFGIFDLVGPYRGYVF
jgi:uncharacterized phage protein (predicted DNA packaging)